MFKNLRWQRYLLGFGIAATLISASAVKASAQSMIIINGGTRYHRRHHNPKVSNFIYGSPISTPIPVNPVIGHPPKPSYFSKPYRKRRVYNSTFIHPVLVNPKLIKDSRRVYPNRRRYYRKPASRIINPVLVNPKIIKDSRRAYPNHRRYYRKPASRIIINSPY